MRTAGSLIAITLVVALVLLMTAPATLAQTDVRSGDPYWTTEGVQERRPDTLPELAGVEKPGIPVFDETCRCWFVSANGSLAKVTAEGGLEVVADDVQGVDVDVHWRAGVAVSREPGDKIVLHRFGDGATGHVVLAAGPGFFSPRLAPDGASVLVSESRAGGGHIWLLKEGEAPVDLGQGYGPCWHPDGLLVLFSRIEHDAYRVLAADLWSVEVATGKIARVTASPDIAETEPAFSLDGRQLAFIDAATGKLKVVASPALFDEEGR